MEAVSGAVEVGLEDIGRDGLVQRRLEPRLVEAAHLSQPVVLQVGLAQRGDADERSRVGLQIGDTSQHRRRNGLRD